MAMDLFQYRITHYDPALRDADGRFVGDQWTCVSDIGKPFDGKFLTDKAYLATESAYVAAALALFDTSGLSHLRATNPRFTAGDAGHVEKAGALARQFAEPVQGQDPSVFECREIVEDELIERAMIEPIVRASLRETGGCNLEFDGHFFVHFGWDFHMYIGCNLKRAAVRDLLKMTGLFVEEFTSPYSCRSASIRSCVVEVFDHSTDENVGDIPIGDLTLDEVRKLLGLSDEHPVCGSFEIPILHQAELTERMGRPADFGRFLYHLDTCS